MTAQMFLSFVNLERELVCLPGYGESWMSALAVVFMLCYNVLVLQRTDPQIKFAPNMCKQNSNAPTNGRRKTHYPAAHKSGRWRLGKC